jgi:hypothetical protein
MAQAAHGQVPDAKEAAAADAAGAPEPAKAKK